MGGRKRDENGPAIADCGLRIADLTPDGAAKSVRRGRAFTLVELLVVISVIVLLMALLLPALAQARKQARAVACRSNLKQWGLRLATHASENEGRFLTWEDRKRLPLDWENRSWLYWGHTVMADTVAHSTTMEMRLCPMARTPAADVMEMQDAVGGTFFAWGQLRSRSEYTPLEKTDYGSYGLNVWTGLDTKVLGAIAARPEQAWQSADVRGAGQVPIMLDSAGPFTGITDDEAPPPCDAVPVAIAGSNYLYACMNRHDGGVNATFLDWSVRKVGLKELWTLRWYRDYDTAGPWTKAGGVKPEDWPEWMRRFKEY